MIPVVNRGKHVSSFVLSFLSETCHGNYELLREPGADGSLGVVFRWRCGQPKIKLWETTEKVGVWMTHNHGPFLVTALLQCQNKKLHFRQRQNSQSYQSKVIPKDRLLEGRIASCQSHCTLNAAADFPNNC